MSIVDIEPNYRTDGASRVMIRRNTIGSYGVNDRYTSWVLAAVGAIGAVVQRVSAGAEPHQRHRPLGRRG